MPLSKLRILTDRMTGQERRVSLRAMIVVSSLPLFGVVAAFGLAPDTNTLNVSTQTVIDNIDIPQVVAGSSSNDFQREEQVLPGDTLAGVLARLKIDELEVQRLLSTDVAKQGARLLKAGNRIKATTSANGSLAELIFPNPTGAALRIVRQGDTFVSQQTDDILETRVMMRSGRITSSFFAATDSAGVPDSIADKITDIFSTQIDFRDDLRRGDTFSIVYTVNYRNGEPVATGKLLAA